MSTQFLEGAVQQRPGERIRYTVDTGPYGGTPTAVSVTIYDVTASTESSGSNVSDSTLSGSASIAADVITTPIVEDIEGGKRYRMAVQFTAGGNTYAPFVYIHGVY